MTPAQLDALSGVERQALDANEQGSVVTPPAPSDGLEWLALAAAANGG